MVLSWSEACSAVQVVDRSVERRRKPTNDSSLTAWDGAFESSLSLRIDHTLRLQKIQRDPVVRKECTFYGLQRIRSFSSAERLAMNTAVPRYFKAFATNPIDLVTSSRMFGSLQRTNCNSCACEALGVLQHMLTWRDGLAKTFEFQTCATQRKVRHRAMPTGGPKIDSGENCFPLKVANQLASYFYTCPGPIRSVVSKQPS